MLEINGEALNLTIYDYDHLKSVPIEKKLSYRISAGGGTELVIDLNVDERKIKIEYFEKFYIKETKFVSFKEFIKLLLKETNEKKSDDVGRTKSSGTVDKQPEQPDNAAKIANIRVKEERAKISRKQTENSPTKKQSRGRSSKKDSK